MATLNGNPSVFIAPEPPTDEKQVTPTCSYAQRIQGFSDIAAGMAAEVEAVVESERHTHCPNCQAGMVSWRLANPIASETDAADALRDIWEACPSCRAEYQAYCDSIDPMLEDPDAEIDRMYAEWCETHGSAAEAEERNSAPPPLRFPMTDGGGK